MPDTTKSKIRFNDTAKGHKDLTMQHKQRTTDLDQQRGLKRGMQSNDRQQPVTQHDMRQSPKIQSGTTESG